MMDNRYGPFVNSIPEAAKSASAPRNLSVAVLGPSVSGEEETPGSQKRKQIHNALSTDGHHPFFPEERVSSNPSGPSLLEQERTLLDSPDVDLVIILHTDTGSGTIQEIAHFIAYPELVAKTAVLFPAKFYQPGTNLFSDTVSEYLVRMPYLDSQFNTCSLVFECRKWAYTMAVGRWGAFQFHSV